MSFHNFLNDRELSDIKESLDAETRGLESWLATQENIEIPVNGTCFFDLLIDKEGKSQLLWYLCQQKVNIKLGTALSMISYINGFGTNPRTVPFRYDLIFNIEGTPNFHVVKKPDGKFCFDALARIFEVFTAVSNDWTIGGVPSENSISNLKAKLNYQSKSLKFGKNTTKFINSNGVSDLLDEKRFHAYSGDPAKGIDPTFAWEFKVDSSEMSVGPGSIQMPQHISRFLWTLYKFDSGTLEFITKYYAYNCFKATGNGFDSICKSLNDLPYTFVIEDLADPDFPVKGLGELGFKPGDFNITPITLTEIEPKPMHTPTPADQAPPGSVIMAHEKGVSVQKLQADKSNSLLGIKSNEEFIVKGIKFKKGDIAACMPTSVLNDLAQFRKIKKNNIKEKIQKLTQIANKLDIPESTEGMDLTSWLLLVAKSLKGSSQEQRDAVNKSLFQIYRNICKFNFSYVGKLIASWSFTFDKIKSGFLASLELPLVTDENGQVIQQTRFTRYKDAAVPLLKTGKTYAGVVKTSAVQGTKKIGETTLYAFHYALGIVTLPFIKVGQSFASNIKRENIRRTKQPSLSDEETDEPEGGFLHFLAPLKDVILGITRTLITPFTSFMSLFS